MTAHELTTVFRQLHTRIAALLSPEQLAVYNAYQERIRHEPAPATAEEQVVLNSIAVDQRPPHSIASWRSFCG